MYHPVHILDINGEVSRSSFIPFCAFGDELIGSEIDGFDMNVCNIFKPKLHYNQLCYETDLQELKDSVNLMDQLELGLTLVIDYNEERQINPHEFNQGPILKKKFSFNLNNDNSLSMHLDTISILINIYCTRLKAASRLLFPSVDSPFLKTFLTVSSLGDSW